MESGRGQRLRVSRTAGPVAVTLNPGSQEAIERGCTCDHLKFAQPGPYVEGFLVTTGCPVHDPKERDA